MLKTITEWQLQGMSYMGNDGRKRFESSVVLTSHEWDSKEEQWVPLFKEKEAVELLRKLQEARRGTLVKRKRRVEMTRWEAVT